MQNKPIHTSIVPAGYDFGKIPPQNVDLEISTLGALLLVPNAILEIAEKLNSEVFYKDEHQKICKAILDLYENDKRIDILTVGEQLRRNKQMDEIGGPVYLSQLTSGLGSASHIKEHYEVVFGKYIQREVIAMSANLQSIAFDDGVDSDELVDFANTQIDEINEKKAGGNLSDHISVYTKGSEETLRAREAAVKEGKMRGIPTPWRELNKLTQGWQPGLILIGARPSIGKTIIALHLAEEAAKAGYPTAIFSLETSGIRLTDRLLLAKSEMESGNFRSGYMSAKDWTEFNKAKQALNKLPIFICDNPYINFNYLKTKLRIKKKKKQCSLAIIDYLQLAMVDDKKNRDAGLGEFTRKCKNLSNELEMPIIVLCQLGKVVETRNDHKPEVSDIRETGAAEGDADLIMLIHRPERYGITTDRDGNDHKGKLYLLLKKQKDGPIGEVTLLTNESLTKFKDFVEFTPSQQSNRDRQLPPERNDPDIVDIPNDQEFPF
jgi:replicative DNA helicase